MRPFPLISPLRLAACACGPALLLFSAGCTHATGSDNSDASVTPRPSMPTVVPPPRPPVITLSETEAAATSLAAARASDFPAARRALETLTDRAARARATLSTVETLAAENPASASSLALALPPDLTQATALEIAARAHARKDSDGAVAWALGFSDPNLATTARRAVAEELVRAEPAAALKRLHSLPASPARDDTLAFGVAAWAHHDADAARGWSRAVEDETLRHRLTLSTVFAVAPNHPARAAQIAETLPLGQDRGRVFSALAQTWIASDATAAMAWVTKLPPGDLREAAMAGVDTGTGAAGRRRHNTGPRLGGATRMGGTGVSAATLESNLPTFPAFSAWLASQPLPMSRDEAIIEFIKQRGALDVGAIGNWITTLPGGPTRQRALETYFAETLRTSPAAAANWLRSVPPSDRSDAMVEEVARRWLQTEPGAAADWLRESNLPQFRKDEILRSR